MKLRSVTYALFIAGLAAFSTSSLAAQSLRFGYETSQTDSQHIAAKKFNDLLQERTKGELKLKLFPDSTLGNAQAMISGVRGAHRPRGTDGGDAGARARRGAPDTSRAVARARASVSATSATSRPARRAGRCIFRPAPSPARSKGQTRRSGKQRCCRG